MRGPTRVACAAVLAVGGLAGCAEQSLGTSRFPASASYAVQSTEASTGSQDSVHLTAELEDCGGARLVLGPGCALVGRWSEGAQVTTTGWSSGYRTGTLTLAAGQTCLVPLGGGTAEEVAITTGTVRVNEAHVAEVSIAAEVAAGTQKGRAVTLAFTAPAEGATTPCGGGEPRK